MYRKDDPEKIIHQRPENAGFHKYYYAQTDEKGKTVYNVLEDVFSIVEAKWPSIPGRLEKRDIVEDNLGDFFVFVALQYVRVPAIRDAAESVAANIVKSLARLLEEKGQLPPKPTGLENILESMEISVDPQLSLASMPDLLQGVGQVFSKMTYRIIHNEADIPFLTRDNPVIMFDPSIPGPKMQPYNLRADGPASLIFPLSPNLALFGQSLLQGGKAEEKIEHAVCTEPKFVKTCNRHICRFAYETIFSQRTGHERLIVKYADVSPVLETTEVPHEEGKLIFSRRVFGKRTKKPKWKK